MAVVVKKNFDIDLEEQANNSQSKAKKKRRGEIEAAVIIQRVEGICLAHG